MTEPRKSARERLAEFERTQIGQKAFLIRAIILGGVLIVAIGALFFLDEMASRESDWRKLPETAAKAFSEGRIDDVAQLLADDFIADVDGRSVEKQALLSLMRQWAGQGSAFTTRIIQSSGDGDERTITFLAIHAQGKLDQPRVIPIVRCWRVTLEITAADDGWRARRAKVTPTVGG